VRSNQGAHLTKPDSRFLRNASNVNIRVLTPSRIGFVLAVLFLRFALDLCYVFYLVGAFGDDPITPMWIDIQPVQYSLSIIFVIVVALITPNDKKSLSGIYYFSILAFLFIPMTSIVGMNAERSIQHVFIAFVGIVTSLIITETPLPKINLPLPTNGVLIAVLLSAGALAVFLAWTIYTGAIFQASLDLKKIYVFREEQDQILNQGYFGYFNLWVQKVFNPFLLVLGFYYKRRTLILTSILFQIYFFAVTSHRTHLFVPLLILLVYFLYSRRYTFFHIYLIVAAILVSIIATSTLHAYDLLPSIFIRRAFFVAASAAIDWISLFESRAHVYFADNLFKSVVNNEYTGQKLSHYVSVLIFNEKPFGFDGGLVGNGYAHLGIFGVALYAALIGAYVRFINELIANGVRVSLSAALLFEPLRTTWCDTDLPTALLTHGLLIGMLLIWLVGKSQLNQQPKLAMRLAGSRLGVDPAREYYNTLETRWPPKT
jgi:hypothetical protein